MPPERQPLWRDALHLFALSSIAIAQPLFDILRQNPTFFAAHKTTRWGVLAFAILTIVGPALAAIALRWLVGLFSTKGARWVQTTLIGLLGALVIVPPVMRAGSVRTVFTAVLFAAVAVAVAVAYRRLTAAARFLTVLGVAPLLVLVLFLFGGPIRGLVFGGGPEGSGATIKRPGPVVMVILDEFSLATILDPGGDIDEDRFPNLSALAREATWYKNASVHAISTHVSVPMIHTGVLRTQKTSPPPPVTSSYPNNLFTLFHPTMRIHADEFVTHLCPQTVCVSGDDRFAGAKYLYSDAAIVYLHLILPDSVQPGPLQRVGADWAGFFGDRQAVNQLVGRAPRFVRPVARAILGRLAAPPSEGEARRTLRFVREIDDHPRSTFHYIHLRLPHGPLELLPTLDRYEGSDVPGRSRADRDEDGRPDPYWGDDAELVDQALQRYLFQAKAADELIGRLGRSLRESGTWDDTMMIVTSDHGISFRTDEPWRRVRETTNADVLPVPLFVKYPGQRKGRTDLRNAQSTDIVPTIADALDIDVPWRVDGHSLAARDARVPDKQVWTQRGIQRFDSPIEGLDVTSRHIRDVFGAARRNDDLYAMGPFADLVGTKVDPRTEVASGLRATLLGPQRYKRVDTASGTLPARLRASIRGRGPTRWIAAALNGRVAGVGVAYRGRGDRQVSVMLSDRLFRDGRNRVELYAITPDGDLEGVPIR